MNVIIFWHFSGILPDCVLFLEEQLGEEEIMTKFRMRTYVKLGKFFLRVPNSIRPTLRAVWPEGTYTEYDELPDPSTQKTVINKDGWRVIDEAAE